MALLKFKRSAVSGKVPALADLELGELAINTFDGKLYLRKDNGTASIVEVGAGAGSGVLSFNTRTGAVTLTSGDVTGALGYTPANKAGDTFTGAITVNNGSHQVHIASDGNIEITRSGGGAYIDFKDSTGEDFDSRIQQSGTGFNLTGTVSAGNDFRAPIFYDSSDTTWYVDPNGTSRVYRFKVAGETEYPGSINGDYEGGYYHFGPSDNTPTGGYGHAHIIRLNANWNVQMFFPTSNTNEPMWLRRKQDGTYSAWRRLLQEDEWIGSKYFASDGRIYATILYDANDGSCYVDPSGTSWFKGNIYNWRPGASNDTFGGLELREADGVANTQSAATYAPGINFHWSARAAARIYMNADGNFVLGGQGDITNNRRSLYLAALYALNDARGTIFYDTNDTGYYADPNSTSRFVRLALGGAGAVYQGCLWAEDNVWLSGNGRKIAFTTDGSTDDGGNVSIFAWGNDFRINNWSGSALNDNFYVFGASRDAACAGNITAYYSDDRLKTKTGTIADALTKVASLEGFTYVENETARSVGYANDRQQVGVSAQAVQAVLPEAVHLAPFDYDVAEDGTITSKSGENYLTVDYSRIVPLLIEAIKELNNKVESLEAEMRSN